MIALIIDVLSIREIAGLILENGVENTDIKT